MRRGMFYAILTATLLLSGCGTNSGDNYTASQAPGGYLLFDTQTDNIPYPNDILMDANSGKIALQTQPSDTDYAIKRALNQLDGFSTTSPISVGMSGTPDPSTLAANVLFIDSTTGALRYGSDYALTYQKGKLLILPLKPLKSDHRYLVVLTDGITDAQGKPFAPDYATSLILGDTPLLDSNGQPTVVLDNDPTTNLAKVQQLEAIRQHTQTLITASGIPRAKIIDIWSFKTQTIGAVAQAFADNNPDTSSLQLQNTNLTVEYILGQIANPADGNVSIYAGLLTQLPYYLGIPANTHDTKPLSASFEFNTSDLPTKQGDLNIPVLAVAPSNNSACTKPTNGWPVVIFQHGITQNRTNLLAIAQSLEKICYAGVAIDLPLHGITDTTNPFYMEYNATTHTGERTFDLDFATFDTNETLTAQTPDAKPDPSGHYYINLKSLLTSRDNVRQSTSDLIALKNALARTTGLDLDTTHVAYVGHSLGSMAPFGFLSHVNLESVVLANPGGGIAQLLGHSPTFGPVIQEGLAQAGIAPDSPEYESFMLATQTVIDDADPINYATPAAANQKILSFETIGDQVIPNSVATAPLAGTEPLLGQMGTQSIDLNDTNASGFILFSSTDDHVTRFKRGTHSSLLDPTDPAVTIEMQSEMASFVASKGAGVQTTPYATSVVQQP